MRVTNRMLYSQLVRDIGNSTEKMLKLNSQVSSGKRINKPSDDPVGMASVLNDRTELNALDQNSSSIDYANGLVSQTEGILGSLDDYIARATELATSQASSTATAETRSATAAEVEEILEAVLSLANSKYGDKYIFSGTQTDSAPFLAVDADNLLTRSATAPASPESGDRYIDSDDNHVYTYNGTTSAWDDSGLPEDGTAYQDANDIYIYSSTSGWQTQYRGNNDTFSIKIGKTDSVEANIPGSEIFRSDDGDIIKTLMNLKSALENNDQTNIAASLTGLSNASNVVSKNLAIVGARINRLDYRDSAISEAQTNLIAHKSAIEDIDYAEAITALENQQTIYEANLKSASMITELSLVDFIS